MHYYKSAELAELYGVSRRTVTNWIEATRRGKLELKLVEYDGNTYIANTSDNRIIIETIVKERKKYKNTRSHKTVIPKPEFFKLFTLNQALDIIANLENHREIPRDYNYFDKGAHHWDEHVHHLELKESGVYGTLSRFYMNWSYLDKLFAKYKRVNIIDVGVGNALPAKTILEHFIEKDQLGRYIAIDISKEMLKIAENNIDTWFKGKVEFEGYERDIKYTRFADIIADETFDDKAKDTVSLVVVLGSTFGNLRSPEEALRKIRDSMGPRDILVYDLKLGTSSNTKSFDFTTSTVSALPANHRFIFELLNIDESLYTAEMGFDAQKAERFVRVRLKVSLSIKFNFPHGDRTVYINKDETILLWRYKHLGSLQLQEQFEKNGFAVLQASQTENHEFMWLAAHIKTNAIEDS